MKKAESDSGTGAAPPLALNCPEGLFHRGNCQAALGAAFASMIVYWLTLAPAVTGEDSGELVAAAYFLGIPHPPGYPLWCLLAHPFTWIPFGTVAWRVALMSAFFASATVYLTALLIIGLTGRRIAGVAGALLLAFSFEFWEQAVIAETYALNAFLLTLCLLLCWRWQATRRDGNLWALAVVFGLSLGNHYTMAIIGPVFAGSILAADPRRWRRLGLYVAMSALAAASMLCVYLYLPVRSAANPPIDWGNPENWRNFWAVLRRDQFAFMFLQYPRSVSRFLQQMHHMSGFWAAQFGGVIGLLGLGAFVLRRRWHGCMSIAIGVAVLTSAAYVQNFNFDREWLGVMSVFGIPAYVVTAIGLGILMDSLSRPADFVSLRNAPVLCAAAVLVSANLFTNYPKNDKSDYYWADDYARNILNTLPPGAIYIPETDHGSFPVLYLQTIEGLRPDVLLGRKYGYLEPALFDDMPEKNQSKYGEFPKQRYEPELFAWLLAHTHRPVYFGVIPSLPPGTDVSFVQQGLLFRALRPAETPPEKRDWWGEYRWHTLEPRETRGDGVADLILYEIHMAKAREAFVADNRKEGLHYILYALMCYGYDDVVLNNAGVMCARFGEYEQARAYFQEALTMNPDNKTAAKNSARIDLRLAPVNSL